MATSASAYLRALLQIEGIPDSPLAGVLSGAFEAVTGGRRWTQGTGSGQIDRIYVRSRSALGAGATDSYNFLAAGSLTDIHSQAIDGDELKALLVYPTSGSIRLDAPAANFLGVFDDASDLLNVPAGGVLFDFGAAGLDITSNASVDVTESTGGATADYVIVAIIAQ